MAISLLYRGAGGGGISTYADNLLNDWTDKYGKTHRGFIDKTSDLYSTYSSRYPNACDKLRIISPKKYRTQMVEELIELMDLGVIRLPYEYTGQDIIRIVDGIDENGDEIFKPYELSDDEKLALVNLDLMKQEVTSIYKFQNAEKTSTTYALPKDKENTMHDDRFYTLILLAHRLYEIRRGEIVKPKTKRSLSSLPSCVSAIDF